MRWDANSLSARMLYLLHHFVPDLYSVTLILPTSLNTAYSLSPQRRLSSASIKFLWLRQIHDPTAISPALDNALSTLSAVASPSQEWRSLLMIFSQSLSLDKGNAGSENEIGRHQCNTTHAMDPYSSLSFTSFAGRRSLD